MKQLTIFNTLLIISLMLYINTLNNKVLKDQIDNQRIFLSIINTLETHNEEIDIIKSKLLEVSVDDSEYFKQDKGSYIYNSKCIMCHNKNPNNKGSIGPDLVTTPRDVVYSKVTKGTYPNEYTPKRTTKAMPRFPQLENDIESIYKYIQTFRK